MFEMIKKIIMDSLKNNIRSIQPVTRLNPSIQFSRMRGYFTATPICKRPIEKYHDVNSKIDLFYEKLEIDNVKCLKCCKCVKICPSGAMAMIESNSKCVGNIIDINHDHCISCMLCKEICPHNAINLVNIQKIIKKNEVESSLKANSNLNYKKNYNSRGLYVEEAESIDISYKDISEELSGKINKIFGRNLKIKEIDSGSCNACDYEIKALSNQFKDMEKLGVDFVTSSINADILLITGTAIRNMELSLMKSLNSEIEKKIVIAVGACACSGGIFKTPYAASEGIDSVISVDVYIPGCPPRPQTLIYGILKALE